MTYLITFQVEDEAVRSSLIESIENSGEWAALTRDSYLVETDEPVRPIIERLQRILGKPDALWLFTVDGPWAAHGDPIAQDHAVGHLGPFENWIPSDWDDELQKRP